MATNSKIPAMHYNSDVHVDDDDSDDDDHGHFHRDDDVVPPQDGSRRRSSSSTTYLVDSWRAIESAAMHIPTATESATGRHSFGSRLAGTPITSSGRFAKSPKRSQKQQRPSSTEASPLVPKVVVVAGDADEVHPTPPPPLLQWIGLALSCALAYALYNIFIKRGSSSIHPILGGVILQFVAAFLGAALLGLILIFPPEDGEPDGNKGNDSSGGGNKIHVETPGILWAMAAGAWVGIAEITSFVVSGLGVPATQFIPINIGGSVAIGSVLGVVLLGETVMCHGWSGVVLLIAGIALVATGPGTKVEEGDGGGPEDELSIISVSNDTQPPLYVWIGPALFCALAYALYNICIKKGSAYINPIVGAVILQFVAALLGTILLLVEWLGMGSQPYYSAAGLSWAAMAGVAVGIAELLSFGVSGMGVPASQSIPILIGGSVGFGAVLGIVMLGEELLAQGWCGVVILMSGIALVTTDPGEKVEGH